MTPNRDIAACGLLVALLAVAGCHTPNHPATTQPQQSTLPAAPPRPVITPRSDWADREPFLDRLREHTPRRLTVHHAGVKDDGATPGPQKMRGLLRFSLMDKPWGDVPYHFVIDRQGDIFAGRDLGYAPDTNTGYDVNGHVGICVNGDLTTQPLLEPQYRALIALLAWLSADLHIPDTDIAGHMDVSPGTTNCPGVLKAYIHSGRLLEDLHNYRTTGTFTFVPPDRLTAEKE